MFINKKFQVKNNCLPYVLNEVYLFRVINAFFNNLANLFDLKSDKHRFINIHPEKLHNLAYYSILCLVVR